MMRFISSILLGFYLMGWGASLWGAPIGFQGNPVQFPYATRPLGPGFQSQFYNTNRFVTNPLDPGLGFDPNPGFFPVSRDPRSRFFDPRLEVPPMDFAPRRGF